MGDELQTAVIFTANMIEDKNVMFLIPQKIVVGKCYDDTSYFYSYLDNKEYQNADDAVREENYVGFYDVKTIGELKEKYGIENIEELLECYFNDLYSKVYYYDLNDENDFENYFMKKCTIKQFNTKYDLNFSYNKTEKVEVKPEKELDPLTKNFECIKKELDENILFQNEAKKQLLSTLYNNFVLGDTKSNIIISGPSGVGKSEMLKLIADVSTQPVLYTKFTPNIIDDAKEYLNNLLLNSYYLGLTKKDDVISRIIIIDDFDKDFNYCEVLEVLDEITKFIRNGKRFIPYSSESRTGIIMDSKDIIFIICGNFNNVKRERIIPMDFFKEENFNISDLPTKLNVDELVTSYGFSQEILESFKTHIDFNPLTLNKTKKIITTSNNSLFKLYCAKLKEKGINIDISDKTIDLISKRVYSKSKNIKNINQIIKDIFENIIVDSFTLGEGSYINVSEEIVNDHSKYQLKKSSKK